MDPKIPPTLAEARVEGLPATAFYLPNFLTKDESDTLLNRILNRPVRDWTELSKRRLQTWPSPLSQNRLVDAPLPAWLEQPTIVRLLSIPTSPMSRDTGSASEIGGHAFTDSPHGRPNHCLINEYKPGQGIMPHEDGSAYHGIVATVSLGAPIVLDVYVKHGDGPVDNKPSYRILQEPESLLITTSSLYTDYLHGIALVERDEDVGSETIVNWNMLGQQDKFKSGSYERETRISLTFRDVKKVVKPSKLIPGLFGKG